MLIHRSNRIGDILIQSISKGLESNCKVCFNLYIASLVELDVSNNIFTDKGAAVFLKTILNNNSIQKINMKGVRLTQESLSKIAELRAERSELVMLA